MAYPDHWLVSFGGALGTDTGERWSCGIRMAKSGVGPFNEEQWLDEAGVPAVTEWITRPHSHILYNCSADFVKCNEIAPDGSYADGSVTHQRTITGAHGPTGTQNGLPFQACVVLSWGTNATARGEGSRGRIYSPMPNLLISDATGLFDINAAGEMADSAAMFLNRLDAALGVGGTGVIRPCIVSNPAGRTGVANEINWTQVDNRIDTQRRRANQLVAGKRRVNFEY